MCKYARRKCILVVTYTSLSRSRLIEDLYWEGRIGHDERRRMRGRSEILDMSKSHTHGIITGWMAKYIYTRVYVCTGILRDGMYIQQIDDDRRSIRKILSEPINRNRIARDSGWYRVSNATNAPPGLLVAHAQEGVTPNGWIDVVIVVQGNEKPTPCVGTPATVW